MCRQAEVSPSLDQHRRCVQRPETNQRQCGDESSLTVPQPPIMSPFSFFSESLQVLEADSSCHLNHAVIYDGPLCKGNNSKQRRLRLSVGLWLELRYRSS